MAGRPWDCSMKAMEEEGMGVGEREERREKKTKGKVFIGRKKRATKCIDKSLAVDYGRQISIHYLGGHNQAFNIY